MQHPNKSYPTRLGFYTQKAVTPVFKMRGLMQGKIMTHWQQIVGDKIVEMALPEKITFPKGKRTDGTLHLIVTSSGALLLHYAQDLILEQVNRFFGYKALSKLRLTHGLGPFQNPPLKPVVTPLAEREKKWVQTQISKVVDHELKAHLEKLGQTICR